MCIDAPESTTNFLSSLSIVDDADRHQILWRWEECLCYVSPLGFRKFLASLHAASRAHRSCHSVSSWDRSSNFGAFGLRWWGSPGQIIPSDGFGLECWRDATRLWWISHVGSVSDCLSSSAKIVADFGGSISWYTQPNCRVIFQYNHCTFVTILFWPFARLFINLAVCTRALFPKSASIFGLVEQALQRMPFFTEWVVRSFKVILARQSSHFHTCASASRTSGSRCIFLILLRRRSWKKIRLCRFCTIILIVSETAIVSIRKLPVSCPMPIISWTSLFTLFYPLILDHGACLITSVSGLIILHS